MKMHHVSKINHTEMRVVVILHYYTVNFISRLSAL